MRRLLGFTVVLAALLLPTTAFGATSFFLSGSSAVKKHGFTPTLSANWPSSPTISIGFTRTSGRVAPRTQTSQMQTWSFALKGVSGAPASISFNNTLGSGHVRAGGKMGSWGSVRFNWTPTSPLKVRHPCGGQTVRTRSGLLDGRMVLHAGTGWQTVKVFRYRATVTKTSGKAVCPFPPVPTTCPKTLSLNGSVFVASASAWTRFGSISQQGARTTATFFANRKAGRAGLSKVLTELVPNSKLTGSVPASGAGAVHLAIPSTRAIYGRINVNGTSADASSSCKTRFMLNSSVTGTGMTARFFGLGKLKIPAGTGPRLNWSAQQVFGKA